MNTITLQIDMAEFQREFSATTAKQLAESASDVVRSALASTSYGELDRAKTAIRDVVVGNLAEIVGDMMVEPDIVEAVRDAARAALLAAVAAKVEAVVKQAPRADVAELWTGLKCEARAAGLAKAAPSMASTSRSTF
jgi:hypothetical protein